jgi:putative transposase
MRSVPEALRGREEVGLGRRPSPDLEPSEAAEPKAGLVEGELEVPRKPSATWTGHSKTSSPLRGASGKAPSWLPQAEKKGRCRDSFRFSTGVMRGSGTMVTLPRLGTIRTHETTEALARKIVEGKARILSATVSRTAQRWFVSFTVEVDPNLPDRHPRPGTAVGVDVGLKALVTAVDHRGQVIPVPGPRPLRTALRRLRRASRAQSRKQKGSANRQKSARRLARIHARIANCRGTPRSQLRGDPCRLDALHQLTKRLAARYETMVVEDLNVAGMLGNRRGTPRSQLRGDPRRLARSLADRAFGELRRQLGSKTGWRSGRVIVADRFFPSSKTCSAGGTVKAKRSLDERVFTGEGCGLVIDRDVNAAKNLLAGSGRGAGGAEGRPSLAGHTAITGVPAKPASRGAKQEPGTAQAGKTGTARGPHEAGFVGYPATEQSVAVSRVVTHDH